jgi:hypothetical protein
VVEKGSIDVANDEDEDEGKGEHGVGGVDRDIVVEGFVPKFQINASNLHARLSTANM